MSEAQIKETNQDNYKELSESIVKLQTDLTKTIESNGVYFKSIDEMLRKLDSAEKKANDPTVDSKIKKMEEQLNAWEDKYKNSALKIEAEKRTQTVDGLAERLTPEDKIGRKNYDRLKVAKSILDDPHAKDYKSAFSNYIQSVHGVRKSGAERKMGEVAEEIKNSSYSNDESFVKKNLTTIVGEQAGYLAPPEFELEIQKTLFETSPLRMVATNKMTTRGYYEWPMRTALPTTYWGNTQFGDSDTNEQKYQLGKIAIQDLHAIPAVAHNLIEDSVVNIEAELRMDLEEAFMLAENKAFIQGLGESDAQPQGLKFYATRSNTSYEVEKPLQLERLEHLNSATFSADTLLDMEARLLSQYKNNAVWLLSRQAKNTIRQLKASGTGEYLFSTFQGWGGFQGVPKIMDGFNGRILGYPILECDDLESGFSTADNYPIYFGDFSKYCIIDRLGLMLIRDEVTNKGFVLFWFRKRLGAGFKIAQSVKVLKIT